MRIDLSGKKAIVSGSTAGIGFGIARGLALGKEELFTKKRDPKIS